MAYKTFVIIFFLIVIYLYAAPFAQAFTMSNGSYQVEMGNINTTAGKKSNSSYTLRDSVGQIGPGLSTSSGYKVKAGFQYISSEINFSFSVSSQFIDFGILSATSPVTRVQTLTISNGSAGGFSITADENHPLLVPASGNKIPDTTCDSGTCSETTSGAWTSNLTYGFGYRCDNVSGSACVFTTANNYKQFADKSNSENPQAVMSGTNVGTNIQSQITYKVNVSTTQAPGLYGNTVEFIATPTF